MSRRVRRREGPAFQLSAPSQGFFLFSLLLVGLALAGRYTPIEYLTPNVFWFAVAGYGVLALGVLFRRA